MSYFVPTTKKVTTNEDKVNNSLTYSLIEVH